MRVKFVVSRALRGLARASGSTEARRNKAIMVVLECKLSMWIACGTLEREDAVVENRLCESR